ncbi:MAG: SSS family solute:Na+ symporter, partial [Candidatus Pelagisphaera sp.]
MEIDALAWQDWAIVILYALGVLWVGWRFSRGSESEEEYFLGGRSMSPFLIGISLFASLLSTVSYLAYPGEIIQHGPIYLTGIISVPIAYFIVGYWLIPIYMKQNVTSAYELLEDKLGLSARVGGAVLFVFLR